MTREGLIRAGVDYDGGVRRFAGKQQLYERFLLKFFDGNAFVELRSKLDAGDCNAAFRIAHDLRGVAGNLSMGRLYDRLCELTECLRAGEPGERALLLCGQAMELYREAERAVRE